VLHEDITSIVYVTWEQAEAAAGVVVEYSVDDGKWMETPAQDLGAGSAAFMLLGIPYTAEFAYRIRLEAQTSDEHTASAGALPAGLPTPDLLLADEDAWFADGQYLILSVNGDTGGWTGGDYWKIIVDRQARVVWAQMTEDEYWTIFARISRDGDDILWDESSFWAEWDQGASSRVVRTKIDGTIVESVDTPGLHHAFVELEDDVLAWGAATFSTEKLVKRTGAGAVEVIWDCDRFHSDTNTSASCQSNTLFWDEPSDTFLMSFYTTSTVTHIDHQTGQTLRYWGNMDGPWVFAPEESLFSWQHGVHFTEEGTLLLSTHTVLGDLETVVREYDIDDNGQILNQIWSFGVGEGVHARTAGEAHRLDNGNTLHNYGSDGRLREVTEDGEVVWDIAWDHGGQSRLIGRSIFTDSLYHFAP
jgi:hypothetical protein